MGTDADEAQPFALEVDRDGTVGRMRLTGELDLDTSAQVLDAINRPEVAGVDRWEVDCRDLVFVDSGGLRALLATAEQAGGLGSLTLVAPHDQLRHLLEAAGLLDAIAIAPA